MFAEELTLIKEAEEKADLLKRKSKVEAKTIALDGKIEVAEIIENAKAKAKEKYDALVIDGEQKAEVLYEEYLKSAKIDSLKMVEDAKLKESNAVAAIAERIVKFSVNN